MTDRRQFLAGSRVDDLDLSGVHLHGANLEAARLTDAYLCGADVSGDIEGLRLNGVEIEPLVEAELDRRFPERVKLRAGDVEGLHDAWSMLEGLWAAATKRAANLPEDLQFQRVDGEWSFVETLRHLVFATDCWLFRAVNLARHPYHPCGLPWSGAGPELAQELGLEIIEMPGMTKVLAVRLEHQRAVRRALADLTDHELTEVRRVPDEFGHPNGEHSVLDCLHVLLKEEWEHHRYAVRDLEVLELGVQGI